MSINWNEAPEWADRAMKSQSGLLFFCSVEKYLHAGEESKDGSPVMFGGRSCFTIGEFKLVEMRPINSGINVENKDHLAYREVKPCESGSETDSIDSTLKDANLSAEDIDKVFLTGGSSYIPLIRNLFEKRVGSNKILSADAFTSVAYGLGLHGTLIR